ncbi:transglutaminase domain-containing protein [Ureibacillus sp. MALMAid1270]|uniref:transglutaminase domain-containing protein n=1 Tax=Ureibacillus sp. MALMAid1270 TaxID=3411629 RepID=UPI003BA7D2A9
MKIKNFHSIELAVYYLIIFLILQEWLIPILELTKTGHLGLILVFIALCLISSLLNLHFILSWIVKVVYIAWFITSVYSDLSIFSSDGLGFLLFEMQYNLITVFSGRWLEITDPFRTFLFFILIWMLIYLIHYWITVRRTIFYFLVLTIFFIATLDTFTEYDGTFAMVKVVLLGLLMTVFLYLKGLIVQAGITIPWHKYINLLIPAILLIGLVNIFGLLLPKSEPIWPDPVPFIKSATGQGEGESAGNGVSKVGYGTNDGRLGGAFVADDTVVFMAEAESKQYWRVETKDFYTSKGWEQSAIIPDESAFFSIGTDIQYSLPTGPEEEEKVAQIVQLEPFDFILQPYGLKRVEIDPVYVENYTNVGFIMNTNSEKLYPYGDNKILTTPSYSVVYSKPTYLYSELTSEPSVQIDETAFQQYLQLPETLPDRVVELANDIVKGAKTPYQKARAIESYFSRNGFKYETTNVAIPTAEQDYVDQFLFETKMGYCDNFSTSMVIMLRSIGIPARWVKGFMGGEIVDSNGAIKTFEITNNNAHSWVEAYIPDVGWVNFEPTIGFSNMRSIEFDVETTNPEDELVLEEQEQPVEELDREREQPPTTKEDNKNFFASLMKIIDKNRMLFVSINLTILFVGLVLLITRKKWLPKVYVQMNRRKTMSESSFEAMFLQLLKVLEYRGMKRKKDQTLTSFAKEVDQALGTYEMSKITRVYEEYIYGKNLQNIDFDKMKESWEYLINRSSS